MANTTEADWDESSPSLAQPRRAGALEITSLRKAVGQRLSKEHVDPAAVSVGGEHLMGSAIEYYQANAPTLRPDGATPLDTDDTGRKWIDSDTARPYVWTGSAWIVENYPTSTSFELYNAAPYTLPFTKTGLADGKWLVWVIGRVTVAGTVNFTLNSQTRTYYNTAVGAVISVPIIITLSTGSLSISAATDIEIQGMIAVRITW